MHCGHCNKHDENNGPRCKNRLQYLELPKIAESFPIFTLRQFAYAKILLLHIYAHYPKVHKETTLKSIDV